MAFLQQKECPNKKIEENQKVLELNFLSNSNCASLDFEIYFLPANLTEPYWRCIAAKRVLGPDPTICPPVIE